MKEISLIITGSIVAVLLVSIVYPLIVLLVNYIFRMNIDIAGFEKFKKALFNPNSTSDIEDNLITQVGFCMGYFVIAFVLAMINMTGVFLIDFPIGLERLNTLLLILLSLPLARWLVDVARNLKIKRSSGDSETLAKLQSQIEELNNKIEGAQK